ncbi:MAG: hypothetical protein HY892_11485 [Deltaproteobacteria bacterium]|nr:hypothetical protein [Deltaproteobacteria bacterium]
MMRWFILLFGAVGVISGLRAIRKRTVYTDVGEYRGDTAVRWGAFAIFLGGLFILAGVFDPPWLPAVIRLFLGN